MRWSWLGSASEEPLGQDLSTEARKREIAHLRQVINSAKVVVALTAAIAATFVAGTFQDHDGLPWLDEVSAGFMAFTLAISFWLIAQPVPSHAEMDAKTFNDVRDHARWTHRLTQVQVVLSALSCVAATFGLLWGH